MYNPLNSIINHFLKIKSKLHILVFILALFHNLSPAIEIHLLLISFSAFCTVNLETSLKSRDVYWIWTKCEQTQYLMDKAILGKLSGVYVTYVADADKTNDMW